MSRLPLLFRPVVFTIAFCFASLAAIRADDSSNQPLTPPAPALSAQEPGTWINVTPPDLLLKSKPFGTQSIYADPARPGDIYCMGNAGGLWKSTDFGTSWVHSDLVSIYAMAIDPNPKRDPATPPTLWACGYYAGGALRSIDGGKTWALYKLNTLKGNGQQEDEPYDFEIDPTDSNHLLVGIHQTTGVYESHDGGKTWTRIKAADNKVGGSLYCFFIDPSPDEIKAGATKSSTWLTISQVGSGGTFRTTDGGATFTQVEKLQHLHGNAQMFNAGGGVVYMAGIGGTQGKGVYRSADYGMTWTRVNGEKGPNDPGDIYGIGENDVYGTPNYIYAENGWATGGEYPPNLERAPRATGTKGAWTKYYPNAPMTNGSGHAAVTFDDKHYVILTANWHSGVWRYVEQ